MLFRVPAEALRGLGDWARATLLPSSRWVELTERTIEITDAIDQPTEVAERCRDIQPSSKALRT